MVCLVISDHRRIHASFKAWCSLFERIRDYLFEDSKLWFLCDQVLSGESRRIAIYFEGVFRFDNCICVSRIDDLI